jgi:hypothetical protein
VLDRETRKLNDADLEVVAGGMDCKWALIAAKIYVASGDIMGAMGDAKGASGAYGTASGLLKGACT